MKTKQELNEVAKTALENGTLKMLLDKCVAGKVEKMSWSECEGLLRENECSDAFYITTDYFAWVFEAGVLICLDDTGAGWDENWFLKIKA